MDQSHTMTEHDWAKLESIAAHSSTIHLDKDVDGVCVFVDGLGVFHPRSFLDLIEELPSA